MGAPDSFESHKTHQLARTMIERIKSRQEHDGKNKSGHTPNVLPIIYHDKSISNFTREGSLLVKQGSLTVFQMRS